MPGIFAGDNVGLPDGLDGTEGDVAQISDRSGDKLDDSGGMRGIHGAVPSREENGTGSPHQPLASWDTILSAASSATTEKALRSPT